jgi:hypothetical protein
VLAQELLVVVLNWVLLGAYSHGSTVTDSSRACISIGVVFSASLKDMWASAVLCCAVLRCAMLCYVVLCCEHT